jgi:hypothetical protein
VDKVNEKSGWSVQPRASFYGAAVETKERAICVGAD